MSMVIKAIKFNHDPNSADHDALNIRKNGSEFVDVPEWVQGISTKPEDSLAAYSMEETRGGKITIQARFRSVGINTAEIRAVDPTILPPKPTGWWWLLWWVLGWLIRMIFGNVLGEVKETWVDFDSGGDSGFVTFELKNPNIWNAGVGIRYTTWKWQYRLTSGSPWIDIDTTRHKIYVVLEIPKEPWKQTPYVATNDQLPWTDVLDYSCWWAKGSKDRDTASGKITEMVNALGSSVIEYDCPGGGATHYAWPDFNCTEFLERVKGGLGLGKYVNCTDCATVVSTFANILGCDLWQSRMGYGFALNEILAIGSSVWQSACGWSGFSYHEVAWKGTCGVDDEVFDACLKVDGDSDPTGGPPHTPLLPANMKFGNIGDLLYRDRLATQVGRPNCNPQPTTRTRRLIT